MARQWILNSQDGFEASLEYQQNVKIPSASELAPNEVLVKLHAASLNYRELVIAGPMGINGPINPPVIPACDGAGEVLAVGSSVRDFNPGDRVVTHLAPEVAEASGDDAFGTVADAPGMLGQGTDGTLRSEGVFSEKALVHAPKSIDWLPAGTLTCTWLTAWNVFFGFKGREVKPGSWVLVQGTGGASADPVPLFSVLFHSCVVRGVLGGTRRQLKEVVQFIDEHEIKPAVDDVVFELADAKGAYRRLKEKKHFSKVLIKIDH